MASTKQDYTWINEPLLDPYGDAYCMAWVRGMGPEELLRQLGAPEVRSAVGTRALWFDEPFSRAETSPVEELVGVAAVGAWSLLVQANGTVGINKDLMEPLSRGTRIVAHFRNVNGLDRFTWFEDGEQRLDFEPSCPALRWGTDPDGTLDAMRLIGFDPDDTDTDELCVEAAFALAEHLTAVKLTPDMLENAAFTCGLVTPPHMRGRTPRAR